MRQLCQNVLEKEKKSSSRMDPWSSNKQQKNGIGGTNVRSI